MSSYDEILLDEMLAAEVELVVGLPETHMRSLFGRVAEHPEIRYVQVTNEAEIPGILAGAYLGGVRAIGMMENSGPRQACEAIARLAFSHHLPMVFLMANRGELGERHWWGHNHFQTMDSVLAALRIPVWKLYALSQLSRSIERALVHADTSQWPVALVLGEECVDGAP